MPCAWDVLTFSWIYIQKVVTRVQKTFSVLDMYNCMFLIESEAIFQLYIMHERVKSNPHRGYLLKMPIFSRPENFPRKLIFLMQKIILVIIVQTLRRSGVGEMLVTDALNSFLK